MWHNVTLLMATSIVQITNVATKHCWKNESSRQRNRLGDVQSSSKAETREYEVIKDSDQMRGVLLQLTICVQSAMESKDTHTSNRLVLLTNQNQDELARVAEKAGENTEW